MTENTTATTATTPAIPSGLPIEIFDLTGDRPEGFEPGFYYTFVEHEDDTAEASETAEDQSAEDQDEQIEVFGPFASVDVASMNAVAHFGALVRAAVTNMIVDAVGGQHGACGCGSCDDKSEEAA